MCFPDEGPTMEFLVLGHDSIAKAYLVQWLGSAPKWEDEKSLRRLLGSNPQHMRVPADELDANDPLLLEYSRYETSGARARTAAKNATKAIQINVDQLEQASDAEDDEEHDAPPTKRARNARAATTPCMTINAGGVGTDLQPFFKCPISLEVMVDPVVGEDGQTYEREALAHWLHVTNISPMTGERMGARMVPNYLVKSMIANLSSTSA